jgi:hypothetical protein
MLCRVELMFLTIIDLKLFTFYFLISVENNSSLSTFMWLIEEDILFSVERIKFWEFKSFRFSQRRPGLSSYHRSKPTASLITFTLCPWRPETKSLCPDFLQERGGRTGTVKQSHHPQRAIKTAFLVNHFSSAGSDRF